MTPEQSNLIDRIRTLIADEPVVREVSMFGGRSVMVNDKMIVSALKTGSLLVRVDASEHDEHLGRHGAIQAQMGAGRDMGPGWIEVIADAIADDDQLAFWVAVALDHNRAVTGGLHESGSQGPPDPSSRAFDLLAPRTDVEARRE